MWLRHIRLKDASFFPRFDVGILSFSLAWWRHFVSLRCPGTARRTGCCRRHGPLHASARYMISNRQWRNSFWWASLFIHTPSSRLQLVRIRRDLLLNDADPCARGSYSFSDQVASHRIVCPVMFHAGILSLSLAQWWRSFLFRCWGIPDCQRGTDDYIEALKTTTWFVLVSVPLPPPISLCTHPCRLLLACTGSDLHLNDANLFVRGLYPFSDQVAWHSSQGRLMLPCSVSCKHPVFVFLGDDAFFCLDAGEQDTKIAKQAQTISQARTEDHDAIRFGEHPFPSTHPLFGYGWPVSDAIFFCGATRTLSRRVCLFSDQVAHPSQARFTLPCNVRAGFASVSWARWQHFFANEAQTISGSYAEHLPPAQSHCYTDRHQAQVRNWASTLSYPHVASWSDYHPAFFFSTLLARRHVPPRGIFSYLITMTIHWWATWFETQHESETRWIPLSYLDIVNSLDLDTS